MKNKKITWKTVFTERMRVRPEYKEELENLASKEGIKPVRVLDKILDEKFNGKQKKLKL